MIPQTDFMQQPGGLYNCLIQGFAGVSADDSALYITPHLPKEWKKMEFVVMYKGCRLEIRVSHDKVDIYKTGDTYIHYVYQ